MGKGREEGLERGKGRREEGLHSFFLRHSRERRRKRGDGGWRVVQFSRSVLVWRDWWRRWRGRSKRRRRRRKRKRNGGKVSPWSESVDVTIASVTNRSVGRSLRLSMSAFPLRPSLPCFSPLHDEPTCGCSHDSLHSSSSSGLLGRRRRRRSPIGPLGLVPPPPAPLPLPSAIEPSRYPFPPRYLP